MALDIFTLQNALWFLLASITFVLLSSYIPKWTMSLKYRNLPPGPFNWPILGYVSFFDPNTGYKEMKKCAEKYGHVFSVYLGSKHTVIIHDWEALKSCYNREEFLGKDTTGICVSPDVRQVSIGDICGPAWKEQRKFFFNCLRVLALRSEEYSSMTMSQIADVIANLKRKQGQDVNVNHEVELALNNVAYQLFFGKTFDHDHPFIKLLGQYNDAMMLFLAVGVLKLTFPWLSMFINILPAYKRCKMVLAQMDNVIKDEVKEHQQSLNESDPRDYMDHFLIQMRKPDLSQEYNMHTLLGNLKFQLIAASETTRNSLVWFTMLMAKHRNIQEEIQKEIDLVLGREREPLSSDKPNLPLLEAAILEGMRFRNIGHITPPRNTTKDTTLCGYDIPKGSTIVFALTSHLRDPNLWRNPDKYCPARFLSQDKQKVIVPEFFIPFSYGKRNCPGDKFATSTLFLFSACLLQRFRILPPEGGVNLDIKVILNNGQAHPYVRFEWRD